MKHLDQINLNKYHVKLYASAISLFSKRFSSDNNALFLGTKYPCLKIKRAPSYQKQS